MKLKYVGWLKENIEIIGRQKETDSFKAMVPFCRSIKGKSYFTFLVASIALAGADVFFKLFL